MNPIRIKKLLLYGAAFAGLLLLLKVIEYRFLVKSFTVDIYLGAVALVFTFLGIWLANKILPDRDPRYREIRNQPGEHPAGILTERELDVLKNIADGKSNQEIAQGLFISIHTVKTHTTNIFDKLQVKRRTQAVLRAKELGILREKIS